MHAAAVPVLVTKDPPLLSPTAGHLSLTLLQYWRYGRVLTHLLAVVAVADTQVLVGVRV